MVGLDMSPEAIAYCEARNPLPFGKKQEPKSDFSMPSPAVNKILTGFFSLKAGWVTGGTLPVGASLVAVARKPTGPGDAS